MMSAVLAYIKTIIGFLMFAAFVEMLLPGGKWKNFCSILMGLLLIAILMEPIHALMDLEIHLPAFAAKEAAVEVEEVENPMAKNIYETQMAARLEEALPFSGEVSVSAGEDGSLLEVSVLTEEAAEEAAQKTEETLRQMELAAERITIEKG